MVELFGGIFCGGIIFCFIAFALSQTDYFCVEHPKAGYSISGATGFFFAVLLFLLFVQTTNINKEKFCAEFEAKKFTYETAVADKNITGLERLQITSNIMDINADLAEEKVDIVQWYNFTVSDESIEKILSLTPIQ